MATSSIAVALFLSSYSSSQAANYSFLRPKLYSYTQNITVPEYDFDDLGINAGSSREELGIDPTFQDSLVKQGFNSSQIQKIFTTASLNHAQDQTYSEDLW